MVQTSQLLVGDAIKPDAVGVDWLMNLMPPFVTLFNIHFYFEAFLDNFQLVGVFT